MHTTADTNIIDTTCSGLFFSVTALKQEELMGSDIWEKLEVSDICEKLEVSDIWEKLEVSDIWEKLEVSDIWEKLDWWVICCGQG